MGLFDVSVVCPVGLLRSLGGVLMHERYLFGV